MRKVTIVAYDEHWADLFEAESSLLQLTLGKVALRIHHIGSTSVPGLAAKPVIDILLDFALSDAQIVKHQAFRDYLIKNKKAAEQYAEIKRVAALASENDPHRYSAFKADFIEHHLRLALMDLE